MGTPLLVVGGFAAEVGVDVRVAPLAVETAPLRLDAGGGEAGVELGLHGAGEGVDVGGEGEGVGAVADVAGEGEWWWW